MWKDLLDILKSVAVLALIIIAILVLPFFLAGVVLLLVGYMIFIIIRAIRLKKERDRANEEKNTA
jgi:chromate transport protein ChrA